MQIIEQKVALKERLKSLDKKFWDKFFFKFRHDLIVVKRPIKLLRKKKRKNCRNLIFFLLKEDLLFFLKEDNA